MKIFFAPNLKISVKVVLKMRSTRAKIWICSDSFHQFMCSYYMLIMLSFNYVSQVISQEVVTALGCCCCCCFCCHVIQIH